jgi:hypothetical protein
MADIKSYSEMSDAEITKIVETNIRRSVGYYDSEISTERRRVIEYYNGKLPKAPEGKSKYVSMDVYDSVEGLKASLLETFAAGNRIVKFAPQGPEDVAKAEVCSAYTDYVCFRQNDLYSVMSSVIHDGLTARAGVAKVYFETSEEQEEQEFSSLTQDELDMLLADDGVELGDSETDDFGLITGNVYVTRDTSQVKIENIAPEEFLIEPQARALHPDFINFCAHRTRKTLSELRDMGYDEDKISKLSDADGVEMETDPEILARHEGTGSDRGFSAEGYQDQVRQVMCYEAYIQLDKEGTGTASLYRAFMAGTTLLDCELADRIPFIAFVPIPIPHAFFGSNFAEKLVATQNARTVLTRSILDHAAITNAPRYMVTKGGLTNPRELIDNRVGGLVNVTRPDAIQPMPQAPLNPFIFQTIKMLDEDKEDTSGVSRLSQGTNKDAVSKQNSSAMIEQLASMSQTRQKIIARNFANQFIKPLFHEVYRLCVENEDYEKIIQVAGDFIAVTPGDWEQKRDVMVELKLGYGEADKEAQKLANLHVTLSQDPTLSQLYKPENAYALMRDAMRHQGIMNVEEYLTSPDQIPPPQPDPNADMQMQMVAKQLEIQDRQVSISEQKAALEAQISQAKLELDRMKAQNELAIRSDSQDLKEEQFLHKQRIDQAELQLARLKQN